MAVPKRKTSKSRVRARQASHKTKMPQSGTCQQCGAAQQPHRVCPSCGHYRGRQLVSVEAE